MSLGFGVTLFVLGHGDRRLAEVIGRGFQDGVERPVVSVDAFTILDCSFQIRAREFGSGRTERIEIDLLEMGGKLRDMRGE